MMCNKLLLFSLILLCLATPARTADINAASCSQADVQAAIDAAVDGDRVLVPAGTCTWTVQVLVQNKGITLQGAGIGQTTIIRNDTSAAILRFEFQAVDSTTIITAFTFDGNSLSATSPFMGLLGGGLNQFRAHNLDCINLRATCISVFMQGNEMSGLIDNNRFQMISPSNDKSVRIFGVGAQQHTPFTRPLELGSEKFIFVEDNTFDYDAAHDGSMDSFGGARYVFRHNIVINTGVAHHGADSGGFRGVHSFEIYENTFDKTVAGKIRALFFRAGTGVVFNNTWTGNYGSIEFANFRSCQSFAIWGICDGSSIWDGNQPSQEGYACLDQIGHVFTENSGGANDLEPLYTWNNTVNGIPAVVRVHFAGAGECAREPTHIVEDREFFADTARPGYTPFTYPHPLRGEGPDSPTNLGLIVR